MDLTWALAADLHDLAVDLAVGSYTHTGLAMLQRSLRARVPSILGATITVVATPAETALGMTLATRTIGAHEVAAVLRVRLGAPPTRGRLWIDLFAGRAGAFDDLEAELTHAMGSEHESTADHTPDPPVCEQLALPTSPLEPGVSGLSDHTRVSQATGVLMNRGYSPAAALRELHRRAQRARTDLPGAAEQLLGSLY